MDDRDLESRLRAYRPAGPPDALRARVLGTDPGARRDRRALAWLPAVAAVLMASFFYWLAAIERQLLEARLPAIPPIEQQVVDMKEPQ